MCPSDPYLPPQLSTAALHRLFVGRTHSSKVNLDRQEVPCTMHTSNHELNLERRKVLESE